MFYLGSDIHPEIVGLPSEQTATAVDNSTKSPSPVVTTPGNSAINNNKLE